MATRYLPASTLTFLLVACGGGAGAPDPNITDNSNAARDATDSTDERRRESQASTATATNTTEAEPEDPSSSTSTVDSTSLVDSTNPPEDIVDDDDPDGTSADTEEEDTTDEASQCLAAGSMGCSDDALCCDGTMCITDGVSTVCAALCAVPTDCVSLCCLPMSDVAAACVPANYCAAPPPPPPPALQSAPFDLYEVTQLTRVDQDLYSGLVGAVEVYVVTRYCYQYVYYQDALLSWAGEYSSDSFLIGRGTSSWECEVANVLVP